MNTKKLIRLILAILLIITALFGTLLVFAGSHGKISLENKQTAFAIYGGILFVFTAIVNLISMSKKYSVRIGFLTLVLNLISGLILTYFLTDLIRFNIDGGLFPLFFLIIIGIEILMCGIIIITDLKQINKNWLQQWL